MRLCTFIGIFLVFQALGYGRPPIFVPSEELISEHRAEVFRIARNYIIETFRVKPIEEGQFNQVRFNSTGVWGDFRCRLKELGDDRFEIRGWVLAHGYEGSEAVWSVVLRYELVDPEGWMYRRLDEEYENKPEVTSWRFGPYRSVPYEAQYSADFLSKN